LNVPQFRFNGFDGEWELRTLKEVTNNIGDGMHSTPLYDEKGDYFFVNGSNIQKGKLEFDDITKKINYEEYLKYGNKLEENSILVSLNGATWGRFGMYKNENVCLGKSLGYINVIDTVYNDFIYYILQTNKTRKYFESVTTGSTIKNLSLNTLRNTQLKVPPKVEQKKIAKFLMFLDEKIQKQQEKVILMKQQKKGLMQKIFSQELRFKGENGQEYPEWEMKTITEIAEIIRGIGLNKDSIQVGGRYSCILYGELFTKYTTCIDKVESNTNDTSNVISKIGDILMPTSDVTPSGLAKACCVLVGGVYIGGDINIIRSKDNVDPIFLSYQLNFFKNKIIRLVSGTTIKHIYPKDIKGLSYFLPKIEEQRILSKFLMKIDNHIVKEKNKLLILENQKKGFMQKMFI